MRADRADHLEPKAQSTRSLSKNRHADGERILRGDRMKMPGARQCRHGMCGARVCPGM